MELSMMEKQQFWTVPSQRTGKKMNLIAFVFFMIGALDIYVQLQRRNKWDNSGASQETSRLLKVALLGVVVAALIEIWLL